MVKRQIGQVLVSYYDVDGALRHGLKNENVDVHPDHIDSFDELNDPAGHRTSPKKKAPRKATK